MYYTPGVIFGEASSGRVPNPGIPKNRVAMPSTLLLIALKDGGTVKQRHTSTVNRCRDPRPWPDRRILSPSHLTVPPSKRSASVNFNLTSVKFEVTARLARP
jgi:hypothetical protein